MAKKKKEKKQLQCIYVYLHTLSGICLENKLPVSLSRGPTLEAGMQYLKRKIHSLAAVEHSRTPSAACLLLT